ncbi:HET-domain-containing protein [Acephala macrosclerotiorum]|nr:HET-domain-containing protein [Acephala macrosclerotiorum]
MKTWIQDCRQNHDACNWDLESFLPTRLLDLQAFQTGQDVKLVSLRIENFNDQQFQPEYMTPSHCWGLPQKSPIMTTKGNLKDRMTRISIDELSNTFRDAVRITRELGERYLWIDSFCIIQDDGDDWAREAALMADVYGQSFCTLAALDSKDSMEGCQLVSDIQDIGTFLEFDSGDSQNDPYSYRIRIFEDEPREWHEEYGDNPYRHRDYGDHPLRTRGHYRKENYQEKKFISGRIKCYGNVENSKHPLNSLGITRSQKTISSNGSYETSSLRVLLPVALLQ